MVRDSIVMHDTVISSGAVVDRAIVDKERARSARRCGSARADANVPNRACPEHLVERADAGGQVGAELPDGLSVGRNARIGADVGGVGFTSDVPPGGVVDGPESIH